MIKQFFGTPFCIALAGLAAMFGVSLLVFDTVFAGPLLIAVVVLTLALTWQRLEYGILIAFAELFANSHGHLVFVDLFGIQVSLRMAVFAGVMVGWLGLFVSKRVALNWRDQRLGWFALLLLGIVLGAALGVLNHPLRDVFSDGNAYLYLAYLLPILSVQWTAETKRWLIQVLMASAAWVVLLTFGLLFIFTHFPEWTLRDVYVFVRDTRTGELTKMSGPLFRVFLQAQISVVIAWILSVAAGFYQKNLSRNQWLVWILISSVCFATFMLSLSRSFWVGGLVAFACLAGWLIKKRLLTLKRVSGLVGGTLMVSIVLMLVTLLFPYPQPVTSVGNFRDLFSDRSTDISDVAVSSRWKLLPPLWQGIGEQPIVGSGFGQTVTFQTDDPRVRAFSPDGSWTTFALEWGWLELWLKMGILGPIGFIYAMVMIGIAIHQQLFKNHQWLGVSLILVLLFLAATHVFSPYLNHPLGLGLLLFMLPFLAPARRTEPDSAFVTTKRPAMGLAGGDV